MQYEEVEPIARDAAEAARTGDARSLAVVVLSISMYEPDPDWAEAFCLSLTDHDDPIVRGNALLGLGHIARVHGKVSLDRATDALRAGLKDDDAHVRGQAEAAADDIEHFLDVPVR